MLRFASLKPPHNTLRVLDRKWIAGGKGCFYIYIQYKLHYLGSRTFFEDVPDDT